MTRDERLKEILLNMFQATKIDYDPSIDRFTGIASLKDEAIATAISAIKRAYEPIPNIGLRTPDNHFSTMGRAGESRKKAEPKFIDKHSCDNCARRNTCTIECEKYGCSLYEPIKSESEADPSCPICHEIFPCKCPSRGKSESEVER